MERIDVKTKAAAEKAVKAGKPIRIIGGAFTLSFTGIPVNIEVTPAADIAIVLTDCGDSSSRAELWGSSRAELWGSSSAVLWGSSSAVLWGSSSAALWGSSSAVLWGSSSAEAFGYSFLDVRTRGKVTAAPTVNVNLWNGATCEGGRQQIVRLTTARDWCEYYGARIEGDVAVVYKGVRADFISNHGGVYTPGTMPEDTAWNGKKGECAPGCGLNFSPTPRHTHEFEPSPAHYLECRVLLDEMVVHFDGRYPQKCTARRVCAPLIECDVDGNHIARESVA